MVARKYTLSEQAGPVRAIDAVCRAIRAGKFHPDRPVGSEWDTSSNTLVPSWTATRTPVLPLQNPTEDWNSDDEAPPDRNPMLDSDDEAEDLLEAPPKRMAKQCPSNKGRGYIYSKQGTLKTLKFHIAVSYDDVPAEIVGCKDRDRRGSVNIGKATYHVLCDTQVTSALHSSTTRKAAQLGQQLCSVCGSRRRRWRHILSPPLPGPLPFAKRPCQDPKHQQGPQRKARGPRTPTIPTTTKAGPSN